MEGHVVVEDDFQLICFDIVSEPSTPGAYMKVQAHNMDAEINMYIKEGKALTKQDRMMNIIDDILKG